MKKKAVIAAVAAVTGTPSVAGAQSGNVQVFGGAYVEYSYVRQGRYPAAGAPGGFAERTTTDYLQNMGGEIGFKGEEKLGGGLSAWFQCTSSADFRGQTQDGWCSRNSALGLKGAFGNVFVGNWDTPFKRTMGRGNVGANDTGSWGTSFLLTGGSNTTGLPGQAAAGATPASSTARGIFKRRQNNLITYDAPFFGGLQVMGAFTAAQAATETVDGTNNAKARIVSVGATYTAGALYLGAGYQKAIDANGLAAAQLPLTGSSPRGGDDSGWNVAAAYGWGPVRFGAIYTRQKFETGTIAAPTEITYTSWKVGVDWTITGPHGMRAAYTRAADSRGTPGAATIAGVGVVRPGVAAAGASNDNGATLSQIRYVYTFSKRTEFNFGYVRLDNDSVGTYNLGGLSPSPRPGEDQHGWVASLSHRW